MSPSPSPRRESARQNLGSWLLAPVVADLRHLCDSLATERAHAHRRTQRPLLWAAASRSASIGSGEKLGVTAVGPRDVRWNAPLWKADHGRSPRERAGPWSRKKAGPPRRSPCLACAANG